MKSKRLKRQNPQKSKRVTGKGKRSKRATRSRKRSKRISGKGKRSKRCQPKMGLTTAGAR